MKFYIDGKPLDPNEPFSKIGHVIVNENKGCGGIKSIGLFPTDITDKDLDNELKLAESKEQYEKCQLIKVYKETKS